MSLIALPEDLPEDIEKNSLIALPEDLREKIWNCVAPQDRLSLAETCRLFYHEVETFSEKELDNMIQQHDVDEREFLFRAGMNAAYRSTTSSYSCWQRQQRRLDYSDDGLSSPKTSIRATDALVFARNRSF